MQFERPSSLDEALDALDEHPDALVLAGGTDVMVEVNFSHLRPRRVVALRRIDELREIGDRWIGAGVTYETLERSRFRALAQAARTVGSPQIRSAGTIGGNLGTASPAGDALPYLAALDAEVEVASRRDGRRRIAFRDFVVGVKQTSLRPGELIVGVALPDHIPERQEFAKIGTRNAMVISTASACLFRDDDGGTHIALGSVGPTMIRPRRAEAMISAESSPSEAALAEFRRLVTEEVSPITDHRSTEAYRRHAAGVLAGRLLARSMSA